MPSIKNFIRSKGHQILDFLLKQKILTENEVPEIESLLQNKEAELEDLLLRHMSREKLLTAKQLTLGKKYESIDLFELKDHLDDDVTGLLSRAQMLEYRAMIIHNENGALSVAMDDPSDDESIRAIEEATGQRVENRFLALFSDICNIISQGRLTLHQLLKEGHLQEKDVKTIAASLNKEETNLEELLLEYITREKLLHVKTIVNGYKFKSVDLLEIRDGIQDQVINLLSREQMLDYGVIIIFEKDVELGLAMYDPADNKVVEFVERATGGKVTSRYITIYQDIVSTLDYLEVRAKLRQQEAGKQDKTSPDAPGLPGQYDMMDISDFSIGGSEIGGVRPLIESILKKSLIRGASDIHIEPDVTNGIKVRYRVDGILIRDETTDKLILHSMEPELHDKVVSIIKVLSGESGKNMRLDITDRPQDGRIYLRDISLDLRIAVLPTMNGESVVIRVLRRELRDLSLDQLGFEPSTYKKFRRIVEMPYGMILVSGPTGSGKSTTQYSIMRILNEPGRKILTVEDPIEYSIPGAIQTQINPGVGFTFDVALRSFVRNDPDIIMVGEIRDVVTAATAMEAALTGHMVITSIHANDSISTIMRLKDMGVDPRLITSTCLATLGQRLVRRVCQYCKKPYTFSTKLYQAMDQNHISYNPANMVKGEGCSRCYDTGYSGRIGIFELLVMTYEIKEMFLEDASAEKIAEVAKIRQGMRTLLDDALIKVSKGVTTEEEVWRVTLLESASWTMPEWKRRRR